MSVFVSPVDESSKGEGPREEPKEEQELRWLSHGWRCGVFWHLLKKCRNYCRKYIPLFLSCMVQSTNPFYHCSLLSLIFVMDPIFPFCQGLDLLKRANMLREEAQQLVTEGLGREVAVVGSEVQGLYGLLKGAISHSPMYSAPPPPKKAMTSQLLLSQSHLPRSLKKLHLKLPLLQRK